jgi:hypothetical protein
LTPELDGTHLRYNLRNQAYRIDLNMESSRMEVEYFGVRATPPFALNVNRNTAEFFPGNRTTPGLSLTRSRHAPVYFMIEAWPAGAVGPRTWSESCLSPGAVVRHVVSDLEPQAAYELRRDGRKVGSLKADAKGTITFKSTMRPGEPQHFELLTE